MRRKLPGPALVAQGGGRWPCRFRCEDCRGLRTAAANDRSGGDLEQLGEELAWACMSRPPICHTCPFLTIAIPSWPAGVRRAVWKSPKPSPGRTRRFKRRWSRSTMLFENLAWRSREKRHGSPSSFISAAAHGQAGFLSTVIVRGSTVCGCPSALRKNRSAASASRSAESRKSMAWPRLPTARYKYTRRPFTSHRPRPSFWVSSRGQRDGGRGEAGAQQAPPPHRQHGGVPFRRALSVPRAGPARMARCAERSGRDAAIHRQGGPRDVGRLVGEEEERGVRGLLRARGTLAVGVQHRS